MVSYAVVNIVLVGSERRVLFSQRSVPAADPACLHAACQLLCLLQQPSQCWNVPIQALYSHSLSDIPLMLTGRDEQPGKGPVDVRGIVFCFFFLFFLSNDL